MPDPVAMQVNTESADKVIQLLDLLKEKDDEIIELSKIVKMKDLERKKGDLQVNPSDATFCHQSSVLIQIDSSPFVCSLTCRVRRSNCWSRSLSESRQSGTSLNLHSYSCDAGFAAPFCPACMHARHTSTYITPRDEAVCALTRAMMVPELKGEEYEALLSVLPEEQD
jgi:hypothetical protein